MRLLRLLIYNAILTLILESSTVNAQGTSVHFGIYDFVGSTASEFYVLAPAVLAGFNAWKSSQLVLRLNTGLSFNMTRYNGHYHYLYMTPVMTTFYYNLPNPESKVWPSVGMGAGLLGKADQNRDYDKTHYSLAYGFHTTGRLNFPLRDELVLTFDMTFNLIIPPVMEDVNLSGVLLTAGLIFPSKNK